MTNKWSHSLNFRIWFDAKSRWKFDCETLTRTTKSSIPNNKLAQVDKWLRIVVARYPPKLRIILPLLLSYQIWLMDSLKSAFDLKPYLNSHLVDWWICYFQFAAIRTVTWQRFIRKVLRDHRVKLFAIQIVTFLHVVFKTKLHFQFALNRFVSRLHLANHCLPSVRTSGSE